MADDRLISLNLTHIEEDARTFWGQLNLPGIKADIGRLHDILEKLSAKLPHLQGDPLKEEIYCCPFTGDNCWYRCKVLCVVRDKYLVQYIDFGNCEEKDKKFLLTLPRDFQTDRIKPMAHRFCFHDICIEDSKIKIAQQYITQIAENGVMAKLMCSLTTVPTEVILYNDDNKNINEFFIKMGIAIPSSEVPNRKATISVSSPPSVQKFKNPLIGSSGESSDDCKNNNVVPVNTCNLQGFDGDGERQGRGLTQRVISGFNEKLKIEGDLACKNCEALKDEAHKLKLSLTKVQHELSEAEQKIENLSSQEECWRMKYMALKDQNSEMIAVLSAERKNRVEDVDKVNNKEKEGYDELNDGVGDIKSADEAFIITITQLSSCMEAADTALKVIDSFSNLYEEVKQAVKELRVHLELTSKREFQSKIMEEMFTSRDNLINDLKNLYCMVQRAAEDVENKVECIRDLNTESNEHVIISSAAILDEVANLIPKWKNAVNLDANLVVQDMLDRINTAKFKFQSAYDKFSNEAMQCALVSYANQGQLTENIIAENKIIKVMRKEIRITSAKLKNLYEDLKDAEDSEKESLQEEISNYEKSLWERRESIQDSFNKKWMWMDHISKIADKLAPEIIYRRDDLGLKKFAENHGIVMEGLEIDHFEISSVEWDSRLQLECLSTEFTGKPIVLQKHYLQSVDGKEWNHALKTMAQYNNIQPPFCTVPLGVFMEKNIAYVMIAVDEPKMVSLERKFLSQSELRNEEDIQSVLHQIVSALSILHRGNIFHGDVSENSISVAFPPNSKVLAILHLPIFKIKLTDGNMDPSDALDTDISQFVLLCKSLLSKVEGSKTCADLLKFLEEDENLIFGGKKDFRCIASHPYFFA